MKSLKSGRGGKRAGAGKPKGSKTATTRRREQVQAATLAAIEVTAARTMLELARVAFGDLRTFFDADGNLKPIPDWTPDQGAQVASFEIIKKNAAAGDGVIDTVHKFKVWDKVRALEMLAKHFGLLIDKVELSGQVDIIGILQQARARLAKAKR